MFIHLRLHTEFSVVDGTARIDDAVASAAADGQPALAITDIANLFGAVKFYKAARGKGVKPILGAEVALRGLAADPATVSRVLLLAQNEQGYLNLCELLARAWTQGVTKAQAVAEWDWLAELASGLILLSGAAAGPVGQYLLAGDDARAAEVALQLASAFPHRFYLELQRAGRPDDERHVAAAVQLAARMKLPVVATHPVQFVQPEDFEAHEARVCIAEGEILGNPRRPRRFTPDQYFKSSAEMQALFADLPSALANSVEIGRRCNLSLTLGQPRLPDFPVPEGHTIETYFREASLQGLEERLEHLYPDVSVRDEQRPRYLERLEFEIDTILKMGFPGYFLIVGDFINWAKNNGCPVGPGRGSGAGSLVAYALKITDLDPLQYKLLFERFLNPERVSMPDFDIDFCQANRDRVIEYVKSKYGKNAVSQIATFGTMAARAAIRDVGRVMDMSYTFCDGISKLVPNKPGKPVTLQYPPSGLSESEREKYAIAAEPLLRERIEKEEEVRTLVEMAQQLEGMTRNVGMHAGGVLIAPGKLTDFCPLYQQPGSESAVSQYDKDDVEAVGLVKFDFLGLATLTILEIAKELIVRRHPGQEQFAFENIPLGDAATYRLFQDGRTEAVFQFESRGMQGMLRDARPTRLEDLIALNAMFRPGPMDNIPSFCARKHGREPVAYPHPLLEPVLAETYGIFVYQEQVMQAAQVMAGYSLGGADMLRRAMGKKKAEEMAKERDKFRAGAAAKGIAEAKADEVFDLMEKFAGYGFNKSHAAAYSLLAYHTAWIKVHCTAEFYAANLTIEADDTDKLHTLIEDARRFGILVELPDINRGVLRFEPLPGPEGDRRIRYGLGAVKGTGAGAIDAIVRARDEGGPFRSLFDFCARVDRKLVGKRVVETLVKAGAFDALHADRARLLASVPLGFEWAEAQQAHALQGGLFDFDDGSGWGHGSSLQEPALAAAEPWSLREQLLQEKSALGLFLSGHLFDACTTEVRRMVPRTIAELVDAREPQLVAGMVGGLRVVTGPRGRTGIFRLDDGSASIEAAVGEPLLDACRELLRDDELLIVQARVQPDRFGAGLRLSVQQAWDLAAARARFGRHLSLALAGGAQAVTEIVRQWPARRIPGDEGDLYQGLPVRLRLMRPGARGELDLGSVGRFWPCEEALQRWRALAEGGRVEVVYELGG